MTGHPRRLTALLAAVLVLAGCGFPGTDGTKTPPAETPATSSSPTETSGSGAPTSPAAESPSPSGAAVPTFVVANGKVRGPERITATVGDEVVFTVKADSADEVHVHGYDKTLPLRPGRPATVRLRADIPGVFEVELEESRLVLTRLRVSP